MVVLLGIGFLAGVVTAISPCVLPVLPILLAGSASGGRRRPLAIIAGLVASFTLFTLTAAWLLDRLGLPRDLLRNLAIALLFVVAATLIIPSLGALLERPFAALSRRRTGDLGGGFVLGASLGLVFVPCAGPVLTAVTVNVAEQQVDVWTVFVLLAYAAGAALPMLAFAIGGHRTTERSRALRNRLALLRPVLGIVIAATAVTIALNLDRHVTTLVPGYVSWFQRQFEENGTASRRLRQLSKADATGSNAPSRAAVGPKLADYGRAPDFQGIAHWLNSGPLALEQLRGKVVLVDFWTYSCINCLRTLPHVKGWHARYAGDGLVIVGVHSPEFAFEHELGNVRRAVGDLGIRYPVALDNDFKTWMAYYNQYWPAKYLLDRRGHVRYAHFGEGAYDETEELIRRLLAERVSKLPPKSKMPDRTPSGSRTPESYLGYQRLARYAGSPIRIDQVARYELPFTLGPSELAFGGWWRLEAERAVAIRDARLRLRFRAREVHLVLGGGGRVDVFVDERRLPSVTVAKDDLYTLVRLPKLGEHLLELRFAPGVAGYAFTFG